MIPSGPAKNILQPPYLGSLQQADLLSEFIQRRRDNGQRGKELRVTVALHNLRRYRRGCQTEFFAYIFFNNRLDERKSPYGTGDFPAAYCFFGTSKTRPVAKHFLMPQGHFQTEGNRLGVNTVRTADHQGVFMFVGPSFKNCEQLIEIVQKNLCRFL